MLRVRRTLMDIAHRTRKTALRRGAAAALLSLALALLPGCTASSDAERHYYAVSLEGQAFGYSEFTLSRAEEGGRSMIVINESGRGKSKALGIDVDTDRHASYRLDPATWGLISCESVVAQGEFRLTVSAEAGADKARIKVDPGGVEKEVALGPDVVFENPVYLPHLLRDFGEGGQERAQYKVLDPLDRRVREVRYTKTGTEEVDFAGRSFRAIILESYTPEIGLRLRLWVDAGSGLLLRLDAPWAVMTLAKRSATTSYGRANIDSRIFAKAGAMIADINALSLMKVRAALEPTGIQVTPESLTVPGQSFAGTVDENAIEGIFEVRHPRYDGREAPPYPPDLAGRAGLEPFLSPEDFIESEDPVLVRKAKELVGGAADSWEAAKRLSRWVADNIGYDIPGGASARSTYDLREGECGAHSRLFAAFCRAVGIPARVVWGCMYVPTQGGSFGQHAWNEVYMGEAGWVPLDTTARQIDYVDSGHIRLGILSSSHTAWNPKRMEILDFTAGSAKFGDSAPNPEREHRYAPFLGDFHGPRGTMTIILQGSGLILKLSDGRSFGLRDADEDGRWFFELTRDVDVSFDGADKGRATALTLRNRARIPRRADLQETPGDVPEKFRPLLGQYPIPMEKKEIAVVYRGGGLALIMPDGRAQRLQGPDAEGLWESRPGTDRYAFERDEEGRVRALVLHETIRCGRIR
jgi:hypothetical protein